MHLISVLLVCFPLFPSLGSLLLLLNDFQVFCNSLPHSFVSVFFIFFNARIADFLTFIWWCIPWCISWCIPWIRRQHWLDHNPAYEFCYWISNSPFCMRSLMLGEVELKTSPYAPIHRAGDLLPVLHYADLIYLEIIWETICERNH